MSWQKSSASLDASAKIYGFRVDLVHNQIYKMLGGLDRAGTKDNKENTNTQNTNDDNDNNGAKSMKQKNVNYT